MKHTIKKGTNQNVIFTLHGTGGHASDLFYVAGYMDPQATLIGLQGEVMYKGMARYFERYEDLSYNYASLDYWTDDLHTTISDILNEYRLTNHQVSILAYSNGANLAINYFKKYSTSIHKAMLLHPSPGRIDDDFQKQDHLKVLLTSATNDRYITLPQLREHAEMFKKQGIDAMVYTHSSGHSLSQDEIEVIKRFYQSL